MSQIEAFPLKVLRLHYFRPKTTAHAIGRARADNGFDYIVKANTSIEGLICATEWIGSSLADSLKLNVPPLQVLQLNDGQLVVGSQEVPTRLSDIEVAQFLTGKTKNDFYVPNLSEALSSIYALDLALGNDDRHEGNFVIGTDARDEGTQQQGTLSVIDYSSSDVLSASRRPIPFPRASNTMRAARAMRTAHGFALASARETISRLRSGRESFVERAMWGMPDEWLPDAKRDELKEWMAGPAFADRLDRIESGLRNGSYL